VVGTDPLHSSPILDLRIRKAIRRNGAKLAVATDRPTALDGGAQAATRYAPNGATLFLSELATCLRLNNEGGTASPVAEVLREAKSVVIVWGDRIGREGEGALTALLDVTAALNISTTEGSGLLEIPDMTNARGLREVGCLPDTGPGLAETTQGKSTEEIRAALESGEIKSLVLFGVDPLRDFPDTDAWARALAAADHIVAFSMFETETTAKADIVFPLETHAEKDGTVTHPDGRLQRVRPSASRAGGIRSNLQALAELSAALDHDTGITSQPSALQALTEAVPFYTGIDDAEIGGRGIRWQDRPESSALPSVTEREGAGTPSERFAESAQPTTSDDLGATGRLPREEGVPAPSPTLTLGTYRDLWAGPITELNPPLRFLEPTQRVELAPGDAERMDLKHGDTVNVAQNGTSIRAQVAIKERVQEGACFLIEGTAEGNANALLNGAPVSVQITKASA